MGLQKNEEIVQTLIESKGQFRQLSEQHSAIMLLIDPHLRVIVDANPAAARFYGYSLEKMRGMGVEKINAQPESEMYQQRQLVLQRALDQFEVNHQLASGEIRAVKVLTSPISIQSKLHLFSIIYDVTENKQAEIKLIEQHKRLLEVEAEQRALLRNLQTGIAVHAPDASIIFSNPSAARLLGLTEGQLNAKTAIDPDWRVIDRHGNKMYPEDYPVNRVIATHQAVEGVVLGVERPDEKGLVWLLMSAFPEFGVDGSLVKVVANFNDITQQKLLELELHQQAHIDFLTGLSNRRQFMLQAGTELARSVRYGKNLSLLMMDIDRFKEINDSHGHQIGDLVLKKLAEVCKGILREIDIIGRVGGEEFAVLLPETGEEAGAEAAERIRAAIESCTVPMSNGSPIRFNVSIGVASLSEQEHSVDVLIARADKALYQSKDAGRNRIQIARDQ